MKYVIFGLFWIFTAAFMNKGPHHDHSHIHGKNCSHAAEIHGDHIDYNHDGHDHSKGGKHLHEFKRHSHHEHVHGPKCSHKSRQKGSVTEYLHGEHWHHHHGSHVHEAHQ